MAKQQNYSYINWTRSDYMKLSKAVQKFNKTVMNSLQNENLLPELQDYQNLKSEITTRKELKRIIKSLKNFDKESEQKIVTLPSGQQLTNWEYKELKKARRRAINRLNDELDDLSQPLENGYSRITMGSEREKEIQVNIASLNKLETLKGFEFRKKKEVIFNQGRTDWKMYKARIWRNNFMEEMEQYKNFSGYKKLKEKMTRIKNPIKFYEIFGEHELYGDLYYDSHQNFNQSEFNKLLESLGLPAGEDIQEKI